MSQTQIHLFCLLSCIVDFMAILDFALSWPAFFLSCLSLLIMF